MTAKPNRILLHFLHLPIHSNAAALVQQQLLATAVRAQSFVTGVDPVQTFIAPLPADKSEICRCCLVIGIDNGRDQFAPTLPDWSGEIE
jgi:hypothetical protein